MVIKNVILVCIVLTVLSGCDQLGDRLSGLLPTPSAEKTLAEMVSHESKGHTDKAIRIGEDYVSKTSSPEDSIRKELIKLYLQEGDSSSAIRHLRSINGTDEDNREQLRTSSSDPLSPLAPDEKSPNNARVDQRVAVDGASVTFGPGGVEVRAGDAVVRTPK